MVVIVVVVRDDEIALGIGGWWWCRMTTNDADHHYHNNGTGPIGGSRPYGTSNRVYIYYRYVLYVFVIIRTVTNRSHPVAMVNSGVVLKTGRSISND